MREHTAASGAYNVLGRMLKQGGINLKLGSEDKVPGVGTTHVALCDLGFRQRPMKLGVMHRDEDGQVRLFVRNWVGGCGRGFPRLAFLYKERGAVLAEGKVALAPAKLTDMRKTYDIEMEVIRKNPRAILCLNPDCRNCRTDWEFSDTWLWVFRARRLFRRIFHPSSQAREHP